jgi:hypothetical protein
MTVSVGESGVVRLEGVCPIEDAEALVSALSSTAEPVVDWRACEQAHTAIIQVLMAVRPRTIGPPRDPFLANHVSPVIGGR